MNKEAEFANQAGKMILPRKAKDHRKTLLLREKCVDDDNDHGKERRQRNVLHITQQIEERKDRTESGMGGKEGRTRTKEDHRRHK